jgi:ketosteroid isomerase-like protein
MKGTHKATGINLKLRVHNLYQFDKNGKINSIHQYFNNDIFDELYKNERTIESGIVYKYHPYIITIRKTVNAYCAKDLETLLSFYTPDAVFSSLSLKDGEVINLEAKTNEFKNTFANYNTITLDQSGNPVCVCYEKEYFVVYSWWVLSLIANDGKKKANIPVMLTHGFDNDGKIKWEAVYLDSNRLE